MSINELVESAEGQTREEEENQKEVQASIIIGVEDQTIYEPAVELLEGWTREEESQGEVQASTNELEVEYYAEEAFMILQVKIVTAAVFAKGSAAISIVSLILAIQQFGIVVDNKANPKHLPLKEMKCQSDRMETVPNIRPIIRNIIALTEIILAIISFSLSAVSLRLIGENVAFNNIFNVVLATISIILSLIDLFASLI